MNIENVSLLSMIGMTFTLILSFCVPIYLFIRLKKKNAWVPSFFIGCLIFVIFALILEQICHFIVLYLTGTLLQTNLFLYALYGALAAAIFEEVGRLIGLKYIFKRQSEEVNAKMYGVGHGGIEAILIVGMTQINNLALSFMIQNGSIMDSVNQLDASLQATYISQISTLWTTPSYMFFLGGIERVLTIILQICLSLLVYLSIKNQDKKWWGCAFAIHFVVDFIIVLTNQLFGAIVAEIALCFMVIALWKYVSNIMKKEEVNHVIS